MAVSVERGEREERERLREFVSLVIQAQELERARIADAEEVVLQSYGHNGILLAAQTHDLIVETLRRS
jgi:hypothetical protein